VDDGLSFAAVFHALYASLCEKEIDSALVVTIATPEEGVGIEKELQSIFGGAALKKILSHGLWHKHD
jgi:hypothetical protein